MRAGDLTYAEFRAVKEAMTPEEWQRVADKCQWEHMIPWAVLNEWPDLRGSGARVLVATAVCDPAPPPASDPALAALCEATREDVEDLIAFSGGAFDACAVCGEIASEHPSRPAPPQETTPE